MRNAATCATCACTRKVFRSTDTFDPVAKLQFWIETISDVTRDVNVESSTTNEDAPSADNDWSTKIPDAATSRIRSDPACNWQPRIVNANETEPRSCRTRSSPVIVEFSTMSDTVPSLGSDISPPRDTSHRLKIKERSTDGETPTTIGVPKV